MLFRSHVGQAPSRKEAEYLRDVHRESNARLRRFLWGGDRRAILSELDEAEREVAALCSQARPAKGKGALPAGARHIPRRTAFLSPTPENAPREIGARIGRAGLPSWALFWADGKRSIAEIVARVECEETASVGGGRTRGRAVDMEKAVDYFAAHAELGYVELLDPRDLLSKARLVQDLRALGIEKGMDLMVHSSLGAIGRVQGGADAVVQIGRAHV